ncbi:hypothetical protein VHEMI05843 [[Torrubiella] hemipterigena]|uniref:Histone deacetylase domain-containing protein n=1 Tax=[Torrubiella] hemipterigena TaxID=1531966 RepID=A0A0A1THZ5_9HYPO|nr:hypothetical protein VHEMI05843 [[Torrubiella] hemipterigena]
MSSTAWPPPLRQPTAEIIKEEDTGLTQSLSQLSLKVPPSPPQIVESKPRTRSKSRHSSASPRRARSPSHGRHSRASTPPLLRKASMNSLHSANGGKTSRRSSFARGVSPSAAKSPVLGQEEQKPPMTPSSVASAYFEAELAAHHGPEATLPTETVVILHDSVYGHRWSRPRTSRSVLSTIVERPERIKASVLGVSMAYVRLGDRHADGAYPANPKSDVYALPRIPFRVQKTTRRIPLTSQAVTNVHGTKWMDELKYMCETAESVLAMGGKELQRPDIERDEPAQKFHEGDLYLCGESLDAMEGALGAVCDAVDIVMDPNTPSTRAFVGVRPPGHHCSAAHPSGFCWVNNVHVGIMHAILTHGLTHAAIIDFDLHHGDGSQAITWEHNSRAHFANKSLASWKKTSIGYFSLHDINSYPCEMGDEEKVKNASLCIDNAHGQSIWNVHLQPWKTEKEFWEIYETKYSIILEKTRAYLKLQAQRVRDDHQVPKAVIFFSAGFDASEWESAGMQRHQVNVPTEFYARLTQDIVKIASEEGLGTDGRVISVLEGGYSDRALFSGTFSHLSGLVADQTAKAAVPDLGSSLAVEMSQKLGTATVDVAPVAVKDEIGGASLHKYDPSWWSSAELDKLEELMANPASPPRKPRTSETPAYFTPTAASAARVVDPVRMRRSLSGLSANRPKIVARPMSPVAPEVPWMVAAHELSKLLIPSERQTDSCRAEELNAEASKARREKQATLLGITPMPSMPEAPPAKMALRERKARAFGSIDGELDGQRSAYSTPRRASAKTPKPKNADAGCTPRPSSSDGPRTASRRSSRRLSATPGPFSPDREQEPVPPLPQNVDQLANNASRPESAAAGDLKNITVKKTRSKSQTRKETTAAPKTPRTNRRATTPTSKAKTAARARAGPPSDVPPVPASEPPNPSVDKITTGMKKIKINLITQAQKEARARNRQQSEGKEELGKPKIQVDTSRRGRSSASAEPTSSSTVDATASDRSFLSRTTSDMSSPALDYSPADMSSPLGPKGDNGRFTKSVSPSDFIAYQPDGPDPVIVSREEPLQWLAPNTATPSANTPVGTPIPAKKNGLFQYAAGIPFAPRANGNTERNDQPASGDLKVKREPTA